MPAILLTLFIVILSFSSNINRTFSDKMTDQSHTFTVKDSKADYLVKSKSELNLQKEIEEEESTIETNIEEKIL